MLLHYAVRITLISRAVETRGVRADQHFNTVVKQKTPPSNKGMRPDEIHP
jgi:hypothetical protein